jgi:hypothetical protein
MKNEEANLNLTCRDSARARRVREANFRIPHSAFRIF